MPQQVAIFEYILSFELVASEEKLTPLNKLYREQEYVTNFVGWHINETRATLAKKKTLFLHSKNKASRKGYKGEC